MKKRGTLFNGAKGLSNEPDWYKDAIIYEVRVRSFFDSNGDGIGDFQGLASKLDYLQDLGVTALWLLPFYSSPLRDDGYDISDYTDVHQDVGTLADFEHLLAEAHRRGLRIITELVLNHTSDQHPWFQRARRALPGSTDRDFYVWSDSTEKYKDARIIFKDFEPSNWSWDPVAKSHFWHRFFAHQPDLNFEHPQVHDAMLAVVDFWFKLGVDGMRLDAVPYLYEEEGTNCENLPRTHQFLRKLRRHVDVRFHNRMLLAEANQWPEEAALYFGRGDECHMNFHFPIMPRIFMSIKMEDRFPIIDILNQTPELHESCQWALFLRNHDELTLEMVTDEERDYMYRAYANETSMRINLGIRRRLAPLVGNDRRNIELLNALLFSLPGTPVIYYGDEIGMGDNVFLGDRNGVRTPMQWNADRNAGFSRATPQRMILPVNIEPEYHYESLNVEAQQNNPTSLLWWNKHLIALRKRYRAFGRGTIEFLSPENPRVLAFTRHFDGEGSAQGGETILIVANLSRFVQFVELDLSPYEGMVPMELFGRTELPAVSHAPYLLTLGGHAFYWFSLERPRTSEADVRMHGYEPPTVECTSVQRLLHGDERAIFEEALPPFLETRKWFAGRGRVVTSMRVADTMLLPSHPAVHVVLVRVNYREGEHETYVLPQATTDEAKPGTVVAHLHLEGDHKAHLVDAIDDTSLSRVLLDTILGRHRARGANGDLLTSLVEGHVDAGPLLGEPRAVGTEHPNAAIRFDDRFLLKVFRRVEEGTSPELDIGRFLNTRPLAAHLTPRLAGAMEYTPRRGEPLTLAVLEAYVPHEATAWQFAHDELRRFYERVLTRGPDASPAPVPRSSPLVLARLDPPTPVVDIIGVWLDAAKLLGRRTAELHIELAAGTNDPGFAPEPYSVFDQRSLYQSLRNTTGRVLRHLRTRSAVVPERAHAEAVRVLEGEREILRRLEPLLNQKTAPIRTRVHGDYHLGQVLYTGKDFAIIDFDGGHGRPLSERRRKRSPFRDVAGMMRSFHYVALTALLDEGVVRNADRIVALPWANVWHEWTSAAFLREYLDTAGNASFVPKHDAELAILLDAFTLANALQELETELKGTGETITIPLFAIAHILDGTPVSS